VSKGENGSASSVIAVRNRSAVTFELMKALLMNKMMTRSQLQQIEDAVSTRIGSEARTW